MTNKKTNNRYIEEIKKFRSVITDEQGLISLISKFSIPIVLDVGCGNGEVLVDSAQKDSKRLYLGFELQYKEVYRTALKIERKNLDNALVARMRAELIPDIFKSARKKIDEVNIFFPDPWLKNRQKKHRIIKLAYVKELCSVMEKGAKIKVKTDNDDYFHQILSVFKQLDELMNIEALSRDYSSSKHSSSQYITPFERIFLSQGLFINYLLASRT